MKNVYLTKWLFALCFTAFISTIGIAQCNINSFTATPVNGICTQDGQVQIAIPGAATCSGGNAVSATIRVAGGTTDLDFQVLSTTGTATFSNLAPGSYDIRLIQNGVTVGPQTVTVGSSYVPFTVSFDEILGETCRATDQFYGPDGSVTASVNRPTTGTYTYEIQSLGLTSGPITAQTYTFDNLPSGNYVLTITENVAGCSAGIGSGFTIDPYTGTTLPSGPYTGPAGFMLVQNADCSGWYIRVVTVDGRFLGDNENRSRILGPNGSLTISYGGNTYNAISGQLPEFNNNSVVYFENIPPNTTVVFEANDGCNTRTQSYTTPAINTDFLYLDQRSTYSSEVCGTVNYIVVNERNTGGVGWAYQSSYPVTYNIYHEQPLGSGNWVQINPNQNFNTHNSDAGREFPNTTSFPLPYNFINGESYRLEQVNSCRTITRDFIFNEPAAINPLDQATLVPRISILEGTAGFGINRGSSYVGFDNIFNELSFTINRVDGMTSYTYPNTDPYNYGDERDGVTINFPYTLTHNYNLGFVRPSFINLPLGEYEVTITDVSCNYSVVRTINLTDPILYDPVFEAEPVSCGSFNVNYDLGRNRTGDFGFLANTRLRNAATNTIVAQSGTSSAERESGTFTNISPGTYRVEYYIRSASIYQNHDLAGIPNNTFNNGSTPYLLISEDLVIDPLPALTFSTTNLFCDPSNSNTGIIAIQTSGTPIGSITYSLWNSTANPDTDAPLQTYNTTDLTETAHAFQNLAAGTYVVRVFTDCGFTEQTVNLANGNTVFPSPSSNPATVCVSDNQTTLSISLPSSTFDIEWYEGATLIGTGNLVTVSPTVTTTYTVNYELSGSLGCTNPFQASEDVTVTVTPDITLDALQTTTCAADGLSYTVSATVSGTAPFTATGTGAPGTWVDNGNGTYTWTSDAITAGTDYNISIADSGVCDALVVAGASPVCCVFEVTCPTFAAQNAQCYADVPTQTSYTEAEFEALGNADGVIGDIPCGVIEITATNSADTGTCPQTVTRTYTVTEYEDTNNNGVRDAGEDTVLNTVDCTQTYNVQDTTAPTFDVAPPTTPLTVSCASEIPNDLVVTASDNCDTDVEVFIRDIETARNCPGNYVIERTYIAVDACGNTTESAPRTITVEDNQGPTFNETLPQDLTLSCEDSIPAAVTLTGTESCVFTTDAGFLSNPLAKFINLGDAMAGYNTNTGSPYGVVFQNLPVLNYIDTPSALDQTYFAGVTFSLETYVLDPSLPSSVITTAGNGIRFYNAGYRITLSSPQLASTEGNVQMVAGEKVNFKSNDPNANLFFDSTYSTDYPHPDFYVKPTTTGYEIENRGATNLNSIYQIFSGTDITEFEIESEGVTNGSTFFLYLFNPLVEADFEENRIDGTCPEDYTLERIWTLTDACGNSDSVSQTITIQDTTAPTFDVVPPTTPLTVSCASEIPNDLVVTASDNCDTDVEVFIRDIETARNCPGNYVIERTYIAVDACGNTTESAPRTITVEDNQGPTFNETLPQDLTLSCEDSIPAAVTLTGTESCVFTTDAGFLSNPLAKFINLGDAMAGYNTNTGSPYGVVFQDLPVLDYIDNPSDLDQTYFAGVTFSLETYVLDPSLPSSVITTPNKGIRFVNSGYRINLSSPQLASTEGNVQMVVGEKVNFKSNDPNANLFFDSTYSTDYPHPDFYVKPTTTGYEIENKGTTNLNSIYQIFSGTDITEFEIESEGVTNGSTFFLYLFNPLVEADFEENRIDGTCPEDYTLERIWTLTDSCGNTQSYTQNIFVTVEDFTLPSNESSTVACISEAVAPALPEVTDSCGNVLTPSAPVISAAPSCEGDISYTYTYTDCQGNSHDWVYTYTIERADFTMPANGMSAVACPADAVAPVLPVVRDNCGNVLTPSAAVVTELPTPICEGIISYTYTYTDCEGNSHDWVHTYIVERKDFSVPANGSSTVACISAAVAPTSLPTVTDNCGNVLTPVSSFIGGTYDGCSGTRTYNYQYQDCEGYSHIWTYEYTISAPVVTLPANGSSTVSCASEAQVVPVAPMVTDNCGRFLIGFLTNVSATPSCAGTQGIYLYLCRLYRNAIHLGIHLYHFGTNGNFTSQRSSTVACVADAVAPTAPTVVDNCGRA
ncbi:HYR-like domain-containing protein [Paenimyroides aestuarii]|uniref:HYR-like domain-containing protein n=1 Tax=Paenimyroides aestuarii TaxID=2968490 RepID=A0ABY5NV87_9FLAO|nr:hypothetical protein [Paenimyroides aestuarii]UUV22352.1 hypothetical protein NPX36_04755 [Paenimyroides aestuarii]